MALHPDFRDLLGALADSGARYLVVGGYAVGYHGRPRFTKDIDVWVAADPENLARVHRALAAFGAPAALLDQLVAAGPDEVLWMGAAPVRVDILKHIPGLAFEEAYARRSAAEWDGVPVTVLGLHDLIAAKRASGRAQDLEDARVLEAMRDGPRRS
jgi:predicted nucleotidyltransferase